ncbi:fibrillarin-like rRNA/tRNA 2'-O-methyltransferase [Candidatus Woesearchaeota archaeon]|nr:fibrillarin-like rRNA/tRNA 2'-O-methyltransferase [Candidatus Woesearchaeota archaeon]
MKSTRFPGIYEKKGRRRSLFTINLVPGRSVYGERLVRESVDLGHKASKGVTEFREWDASKSKLAAAILKGANQVGLKEGHTVLYLGCSTGTTVSHVSDIVGRGGFVFALDFAPRVMREMVFLAQERPNIAPLLADAKKPEEYEDIVKEKVDWLFQDIAQRNQPEIFLKNVAKFLKKGAYCVAAIKARSIDVSKKPGLIFRSVQKKLEEDLTLVDKRELSPFQRDHMLFVFKKR